jgi:hypothetical protein
MSPWLFLTPVPVRDLECTFQGAAGDPHIYKGHQCDRVPSSCPLGQLERHITTRSQHCQPNRLLRDPRSSNRVQTLVFLGQISQLPHSHLSLPPGGKEHDQPENSSWEVRRAGDGSGHARDGVFLLSVLLPCNVMLALRKGQQGGNKSHNAAVWSHP